MGQIKIFVSYRREDSRPQRDRICDHLVPQLGKDCVVQDVDNQVPPGRDFRDVVSERVARCDVLLAVIGDSWLSLAGPDGTRRLDDPTDLVRIEIEAALARGIPVIPVLMGRSSVPRANQLPESLKELAYRQAIAVRPDPDFPHDMERLVGRIKSADSAPPVATPEPVASPPLVPGHRRPPWKAIVAAAVLGLALLGVIVYVATDRGQTTFRAPEVAPEVIVNSIGMKLVLISAGEFPMGSPESDRDAVAFQRPQHRVRITRPFCLGATEVTQGQYQAVTGANPSHFKGAVHLPVERVSWLDAINFCNALSRKEGLPPFYRVQEETVEVPDWNGTGYRLPTEAEWEYACRAGRRTRYSFGDNAAGLGAFAWYSGNSRTTKNVREAQPVGQKRPNAWGLYDMHGNVEEWCWDGYEADYYSKTPPAADPLGPSQAAARVNRGGCWRLSPQRCRSAFRAGNAPGYRSTLLGFRVARVQSAR
jgi:formylglycine-generating enzyme required for sulfatase activity